VGLEGDLGRRGTSVNLFSVRQNASIEKTQLRYGQAKADAIPTAEDLTRWYHLYEIDDGRLRYPPCNIRRLFENEVHSLHHYVEARAQHYSPDLMLTSGYAMDRYVPRSAWRDDIDCGFISIECKSVETLKYNFNYIT
jgi:hypothetical protein